MNDILKKFMEKIKNPKLIVIIGICGILILFISSFFDTDSKPKAEQKNSTEAISTEDYRLSLEENVEKIVKGITGDRKATVVITLDSAIRYDYADSLNTSSSNSMAETSQNESSSSSKTYITFRTDEGGEKPLVVTQIMPEVRGVAIVCDGGDNPQTSEKIKNAVMAALNITSKRIYIAGGSSYEKR